MQMNGIHLQFLAQCGIVYAMKLFHSMRSWLVHAPTRAVRLLIFLALSLCACSQNRRDSQTAQQTTAHRAMQSTVQPSEHNEHLRRTNQNVRICASVPTIEDEYIPLFHTNVFIRTDDDALADSIERELARMHKLFDAHHYYYDDESEGVLKNLKIVNEYIAQSKSIHAGDEFAALLSDAISLMRLTRGTFNIFLAPVSALYAGKFSSFPIEQSDPDARAIEEALRRALNADEAAECIAIKDGELSFFPRATRQTETHVADSGACLGYVLDFGGIAKGAAARKISMLHPTSSFLLSIGSSTIVSHGRTHRIGVASPYYKTLALFQIDLPSGMAISTSGATNSYYMLADCPNTIRCHILDPRTGYSNDWWWSVIVASDNALVSDAVSTALFNVNDEAEIAAIIADTKAMYSCKLEACFVKDENRKEKTVSLVMTRGFAPYVYGEYTGIGIAKTRMLEF